MSIVLGALWVITSFFNPAGYRRRLQNYRRFRAALREPLAAVELSFGGAWELGEDDADILIRVADGDVMWQKERLLNLALAQLPPECDYVAWIDADVLMQDPDWPEQAVAALNAVPLVQLFSAARDLRADGEVPDSCRSSAAAMALQGEPRVGPRVTPGLAWAARRELLERHGLYDGCVIGGGDSAVMQAAYSARLETVVKWFQMSPPQRDHYVRWAAGFHEEVQGRVGALAGEIHSLWHGDRQDRRYLPRYSDLAVHDFDPSADIRPGADGAWRWASDKPALHALLRDYFRSRQEDGSPAEAVL